jgi:hypothetical protein
MRNRFIQIFNPKSNRWTLVDRLQGRIVGYSKTVFDGVRARSPFKDHVLRK